MTPLPEALPQDLVQLQSFIAEREAEINVIRDRMHEDRMKIYQLQREQTLCKDEAKKLLGIRVATRSKKKTEQA